MPNYFEIHECTYTEVTLWQLCLAHSNKLGQQTNSFNFQFKGCLGGFYNKSVSLKTVLQAQILAGPKHIFKVVKSHCNMITKSC